MKTSRKTNKNAEIARLLKPSPKDRFFLKLPEDKTKHTTLRQLSSYIGAGLLYLKKEGKSEACYICGELSDYRHQRKNSTQLHNLQVSEADWKKIHKLVFCRECAVKSYDFFR